MRVGVTGLLLLLAACATTPREPSPEGARRRLAAEDYAGAVEEADAVLARRPFDAEMHHVKGMALHGMERYTEAVGPLGRAAEQKGDDAAWWGELALAALRAGERERAIQAAARAVELEPGTAYFRDLKAEVERRR
jgi:predicted Zn-dependent protease